MITVHHLENSRSQQVLWLLEELGVDYEIERYDRDPRTRLAPARLLQVHPLGKSPVITDGAVTVAESGAIVEYLIDTYDTGALRPAPDTAALLPYRYWLHYAEGSLMPLLLLSIVMGRIESAKMPFFARPISKKIVGNVRKNFLGPNLERHLAFLEGSLTSTPWFAGEQMTAADIQMSFPIEAVAAREDVSALPGIRAWLERIHALPAYRRALERGGPFEVPK